MDQEETYKWVKDRLRDLHSGTLSESDRVRLIELSEINPFVADALEGYELHASHDHSALLHVLSKRIEQKSSSRRQKLIPLSRGWILQGVAASLVIILATWAVIYYVGQEEKTVLVNLEPGASEADKTEITDISNYPDSSTEIIAGNESTEEIKSDPSGLRANAQSKAKEYLSQHPDTDDRTRITDAAVEEKNDYTFNEPATSPIPPPSAASTPDVLEDNTTASENAAPESSTKTARDEGYYANQMSPEMMSRRVTGKVIDLTGLPLIGANLTIPNTNLGTISNEYGHFELFLPQKESDVDVSFSGFVDASLKLRQGEDDVVIVLPNQPGASGSVTVMTNSQSKKENVPAGRAFSPTRPKDDHTSFSDYLRKNSQFPLLDDGSTAGKEVVLEFNVDPKGRTFNIHIIRSSNLPEYDDEAIRLIKQGPEWQCEMNMYPCTALYTFYFK